MTTDNAGAMGHNLDAEYSHTWERIGPLADTEHEGMYMGDCSCGEQLYAHTKGGLRARMAEHTEGM